ncbi:ABC transporter substrate-binding protein [Streptomyces sp. TRM 70351]|uniref:ABC transporter substrate-binding protein n=1 Tax=Streptomyces sp. TRM 70351 TaxID=3116552 RepID=UPI002E7AB501|nr:ABC transporter substrate-binding protein [Streptomyces sp. TRM 70351]MEE1930701.1 ABC transporter substrate-binding protein [Streptomyces sp. TRM 70351]
MAMLSVTAVLAGCTALPGDDGDEGGTIVVGTTSAPTMLDPAGAWDGSWELYRNVYQTLLHFPNSSGTPEPDAARACEFTDNASQVYRCTLKDGLTFSGGNPLDARAVKYSIDRTLNIDAPSGPAQLLASLDRVETSGADTVVFHLKESNATFPLVLATPAASLVDPETYPADRLLEGAEISGSGPYRLAAYAPGESAELVRNESYQGAAHLKNDAVTIRYFKDSASMVRALEDEEVDLSFRGLTPEQISAFRGGQAGNDNLTLHEAVGTEVRYLVFNPAHPGADEPAVRRAVAQLIDRKALVREVYQRTAEPLYSTVPGGITGHTSAYFDAYGEPSQSKAEQLLAEAGVSTPVPLKLWYTTDRYGTSTRAEFEEIQRQLNDSGLFEVQIEGQEWKTFHEGYSTGKYGAFGRGWFPDFPDADNYIGPFVGTRNSLGVPYENPELTGTLLPQSRRLSDRAAAGNMLKEAQRVIAEDARLLPLWQGRVYIAAHEEIAGIEWTIDASTIMRMWELHRKSSW